MDELTRRYIGVEVPDDAHGVLQDVHWATGSFGYFPTYSLGNVIAGQLWEAAMRDVGDLEERIAVGELAPLGEWLRENVHRHGRKLEARRSSSARPARRPTSAPTCATSATSSATSTACRCRPGRRWAERQGI